MGTISGSCFSTSVLLIVEGLNFVEQPLHPKLILFEAKEAHSSFLLFPSAGQPIAMNQINAQSAGHAIGKLKSQP